MKWLLPLMFICSLLRADSPEYLNHKPYAKKTQAAWRGDRYLLGDTLNLILDWPSKPVADISEGRSLEGEFQLSDADGRVLKSWPQTFQLTGQGNLPREQKLSLEMPQPLADGRYQLELTLEGAKANMLPPPLTVIQAQAALAQVAEASRPELRSWLEEANHSRLIWGKQPLWPKLTEALKHPEAPFAQIRGFLIRSYESPTLMRRQPYTVYVPEALDLSEAAPLMILLHGSGGDYRNLVADYAAGQRFEEHPMLIANAGAFRNTEFRHMPLEDVRLIIEDMKAKYNVDPKRIYAQGISLGGRGVIELAALMPDTFAAVSSQGTYGVHHEWMDPLFGLRGDPVARHLSARSDIRTWMPNLATTPVEMVFGWSDTSTRPVGALAIAIQLQRLRYTIVERGFDMGHNLTLPDYDWASTREWFLKHEKNFWPRFLRFRVGNLRHNRFSWIRIDAMHDPSGVAEVEARLRADGQVDLKTHNVAALSLLPPPAMSKAAADFPLEAKTLYFDVNGEEVDTPQVPLGPRPGPMWDLLYKPLLVVVDEGVEDELEEQLFTRVKGRAGTDATPSFRFPVLRSSELTEEQRRSHNLVFVSSPGSHSEMKQALSIQLPAEVKAMRAEGDTLMAMRHSPWSAEQKVLVIEAENNRIPGWYYMGIFQEPLQADWLLLQQGSRMKAAGSFHADGSPGPWTQEPFTTRVITR